MHARREQIESLGRLKRRSDFLKAQSSGQKWVSPTIVVQIGKTAAAPGRFGLTVTKKTSKSAVIRNRIRRRLRALACDVLPGYALDGVDIVLVGRLNALEAPYETLRKDLTWCLKRLEIGKAHNE